MLTVKNRRSVAQTSVVQIRAFVYMEESCILMYVTMDLSACHVAVSKACVHTFLTATRNVKQTSNVRMLPPNAARKDTVLII